MIQCNLLKPYDNKWCVLYVNAFGNIFEHYNHVCRSQMFHYYSLSPASACIRRLYKWRAHLLKEETTPLITVLHMACVYIRKNFIPRD